MIEAKEKGVEYASHRPKVHPEKTLTLNKLGEHYFDTS